MHALPDGIAHSAGVDIPPAPIPFVPPVEEEVPPDPPEPPELSLDVSVFWQAMGATPRMRATIATLGKASKPAFFMTTPRGA
jgi:hypothetical protein